MKAFQEREFLKFQRRYRIKHNRRHWRLSGLLVSVIVSLIGVIQTGGLI